jgi:hypothetical protein
MGVSLSDVAQGALDLGHIIQSGMTAIDQATGVTPAKTATTASPAAAQPTAPAATATTASTQSSATAAALPKWVLPVGAIVGLWWWKPWRRL